jgi:hypothetical protein
MENSGRVGKKADGVGERKIGSKSCRTNRNYPAVITCAKLLRRCFGCMPRGRGG